MSYPALKNLGVNRPYEISGYTLSTESDVDVLRIRYTRQKGSLLPKSRRFQFPRRPLAGLPVEPGNTPITEISPALEEALTELSSLLSDNKSRTERKEDLVKEINELERLILSQLANFRAEIEKL